jgi:hypothetical protein
MFKHLLFDTSSLQHFLSEIAVLEAVLQKLLVVVPQSKDHELDVNVVEITLYTFTKNDFKNNLPGYLI